MQPRCAQRGFTLIELIVVLAVMSILLGSMVPLLSATQAAERYSIVEGELDALGDSLTAYYYDQGSFPTSLTQVGFYGTYVLPGVDDDRLRDEWGGKTYYRLSTTTNPDTITVYSVGDDGADAGASAEQWKVAVSGAEPGNRRTRIKMRIIAGAMSDFLASGGTLTGTWSADRVALGLGQEYQADGFGTDFLLQSYVLRSAGADRQAGTSDDLMF